MNWRTAPADVAGKVVQSCRTWYRSGPSRTRLRRRLYLWSAPVILVILVVAAKMISVVLAGNAAVSDFDRHDISALADDVAILRFVDVIDPAKTSFADADLKVLEGTLTDAERLFGESLARTDGDESCPVRVNLELVQETLGDIATRDNDRRAAEKWYRDAIGVVKAAPEGCFAANDDPNSDRRAIRGEALPRLEQKLRNLDSPPESTPPPPQPFTPPPPPTSLTPTSGPPLPGLDGGAPQAGADPSGGDPSSAPAPAPGQSGDTGQQQAPGGPAAPAGGSDQAPGAAPPAGPGPNMPSAEAPEPTMTPGPGPNMPAPPSAAGGEGPVVGPEGGGDDVLNPVSADRLPSVGSGPAPGQRLGVGRGDPLDRLKDLLDQANSHGENRE